MERDASAKPDDAVGMSAGPAVRENRERRKRERVKQRTATTSLGSSSLLMIWRDGQTGMVSFIRDAVGCC